MSARGTAPRNATVRDVARVAGVSPATVSNVLSNHPRVATATRERVQAAMTELGYQPNPLARSLRSGRSGSIALVLPGLRNAYFAELATEVINAASQHHLSVSIEILDGERETEIAALRGPRTAFVDGMIYVPSALSGLEIDEHVKPGMPMVLLGERGLGSSLSRVDYRNVEASKAATAHLLAQGCRRIVAVGPHERAGSATPRLEGYQQAHQDAGIAIDPNLEVDVTAWHRAQGSEAIEDLLARGVAFDGVFAFNDMLALGAMRALADAGINVPHDVRVIGFDALEESAYSLPSLSTIDPGKQAAARLAVDMLVAALASDSADQVIGEAEFALVERASSAAR